MITNKITIEEFLKDINKTEYLQGFKSRGVLMISELNFEKSLGNNTSREDVRKLLREFIADDDLGLILSELEKRNIKEDRKAGRKSAYKILFVVFGFIIASSVCVELVVG